MLRSLALISLVSLPLIAGGKAEDTYDLVPRFTDGMQLEVPVTGEINLELDDVTALMGGSDILNGSVVADVEAELSGSSLDEILETKDGAIVKMRRTFVELSWSASGEAEAVGESESFDESGEDEMVGRVLELTVDEDGEVTVVDVTEGDLEPLDAEKLAGQDTLSQFKNLLPEEPVEVGDTWDPKDAMAEFSEELRKGAEAEGDIEVFEQFMTFLEEYGSIEGTGTLVSVEDDVAEISWEITLGLEIGDLLSVARMFDTEGELGDLPPSAVASMFLGIEIEGTGSFSLKHHQLTSVEFTGELDFETDGSIDEDQVSIEASAAASGAFRLTTGVQVL